jgi:DNA mismatch endonuclease, patch repair protein
MTDTLSREDRSLLMTAVKSKGNASTELRALDVLRGKGIVGWRRHPAYIAGKPDFYFPTQKVALFIDGCFWHGCPRCGRLPKSRLKFWRAKIIANRRRDTVVNRTLAKRKICVIRVWEHELLRQSWLRRVCEVVGSPHTPLHRSKPPL